MTEVAAKIPRMTFDTWLQSKVSGISSSSIRSVLELAAGGATVPFMARYRKEATGNLDEVQIRAVIDGKENWDEILKRKAFVLGEVESQGKLTSELKKLLEQTFDLDRIEDLYLPFKLKRKTKAVLAKEAGLEPLALGIWREITKENVESSLSAPWEAKLETFLNVEKGFDRIEKVQNGIVDILAERISDNPDLRLRAREFVFKESCVVSKKGEKAKTPSKFERYFDYKESFTSLLKPESSHRYLAMRRGWQEEELVLTIDGMKEPLDESLIRLYSAALVKNSASTQFSNFEKALRQAIRVNVLMSLSNEAHRVLKESADSEAIQVFSDNLRQLLMASPFGPRTVLAVDPGIRTGSKWALIEASGKLSAHGVFYLQSERERKESVSVLTGILSNVSVDAVAVGNGTFGRETLLWIKESLKEMKLKKEPVLVPVNESGASIYSAGDVARKEFPDLDLTVRGAISIGRRLQDPLAELVKIDPKSIGVGQYQHDVSQPKLKKSLEHLVDSCVNDVGVNLNTASEYLLARVSGIGPSLAKNIVGHREKNGLFRSRKKLFDVSRFTDKVFEQAAGFLRVPESENPLDNTAVHPERYPLLESRASELGTSLSSFLGPQGVSRLKSDKILAEKMGPFTFRDVLQELERPGRDPREAFDPQSFRDDISKMEDLKPGMKCPGVITNVTNFGAFVDVGVHQDALIHISQLADQFVKDPRDIVKPGQKVEVRILEVNLEKRQIAATMKSGSGEKPVTRPAVSAPASNKAKPKNESFENNAFAKLKNLKLS
jgi:protein Tex